jgi:hypothetical protein
VHVQVGGVQQVEVERRDAAPAVSGDAKRPSSGGGLKSGGLTT